MRMSATENDGERDAESCEPIGDLINSNAVFGVVGTDASGQITCWNRGAELITQFKKDEALKSDLSLIFTPTDREHCVHLQEMELALQQGKAEDERWHLRKDGTRFWASGALTAIRNKNGALIGFCKIFRDDTSRKRTEEHVHSMNAELSRFAHIAAHDLQQPIRTITTFIQLALRSDDSIPEGKAKENIQIALAASRRMGKLTGDLLNFAQAGSMKEMTERVDCNTAFDIALENLRIEIIESGALIHRGSLPEIQGIATQISQVFQNLISNAIKYRHPGRVPNVYTESTRVDKHWAFTVVDNGIGISPEDAAKVFQPFERCHADPHSSGSGLGLAIVKKIIESHGGQISIDSRLDQGTTFRFTLAE